MMDTDSFMLDVPEPIEADGVFFDASEGLLGVRDRNGLHTTYPTERTMVELAVALLKSLPADDKRRWVLSQFCHECGGQPECQCWNDE
jgi:hypothetical protein